MTLYRLSKLTGISYGYLDRIEKDIKRNPSYEILKKIGLALNVDIQELLAAVGYESNKTGDLRAVGEVPVCKLTDYVADPHRALLKPMEMLGFSAPPLTVGLCIDHPVDGFLSGDILIIAPIKRVHQELIIVVKKGSLVTVGQIVKTRVGMRLIPFGGGAGAIDIDRDWVMAHALGQLITLVRRF